MKAQLRRWWCGLRGHAITLMITPSRLWLECERCGHQSIGWFISLPPLPHLPPLKVPAQILRFPARLSTKTTVH